jgi:hypothetical protein
MVNRLDLSMAIMSGRALHRKVGRRQCRHDGSRPGGEPATRLPAVGPSPDLC